MRLTLRTLLAYLDDILEPQQAKEIGEKLSESSVASALVNRIREVTRRRRLTAPAVSGTGAGIDANVVAEYLDNTLPPEAVADVERVCLESDVHLAEVAASHQILTLVLGEPVDLSLESRERMYALGPGLRGKPGNGDSSAQLNSDTVVNGPSPAVAPLSSAAVVRELQKEKDREGGAKEAGRSSREELRGPIGPTGLAVLNGAGLENGSAATSARGEGPATETTTLPEALRPTPLWRQLLPYGAIGLLLLGWFLLIHLDSPLGNSSRSNSSPLGQHHSQPDLDEALPPSGQSRTDNQPGTIVADTGVRPGGTVGGVPGAGATDGLRSGTNGEPAGVAHVNRPGGVNGVVPTTPGTPVTADTSEVVPGTATAGLPEKPLLDKPLPGEKPQVNDRPQTNDTPPAPDKVVVKTEPAPGTTPRAVPGTNPLSPPSDTDPVAAVAPGSALAARYMSAEGIMLQFNPREKRWIVMPRRSFIYAGDLFAVPEPFEASIDFLNGSALMSVQGGTVLKGLGANSTVPAGWEMSRGRLSVRATNQAVVTAEQPLSWHLGVRGEVWKIELQSSDAIVGVEVIAREPNRLEQDLGRQSYSGAIYVATGKVRLSDGEGNARLLEGPNWYPLTPEMRTGNQAHNPPPLLVLPKWLTPQPPGILARQYSKVFEKMFGVDEAIDLSIASVVSDRRPEMSRLAVECLGLIDAYVALIESLKRTDHEESRKAAIYALRIWLPQQPENRELLRKELDRLYAPGDAEIVYRLMWGFNEEDARKAGPSQQLIEWMGHQEISVRELAFYQVFRLTGKKYDYRANSTPTQLQSSVNRWQMHIKNGALLSTKAP